MPVITIALALQEDEGGERLVVQGGAGKEKTGLLGPKREADYEVFVRDIWPQISTKKEKSLMTAPMVWQVMMPTVMLGHCPASTFITMIAGRVVVAYLFWLVNVLNTCADVACNPSVARNVLPSMLQGWPWPSSCNM